MTYGCILMYVLKLYIYIICIRVYIIHIMNLKINIRILNFLFKSENCYFNCFNHYLNFKKIIWIWFFNLNSKNLIWSKNWYLNSELIFSNPKISISIQKIIIDYKNGHFILNTFIWIWKFTFQLWKFCI